MKFYLILFVILANIVVHAYCTCPEGTSCMTSKGAYGVCRDDTCILVPAGVRDDLKFAILVKYPEEMLQVIFKSIQISFLSYDLLKPMSHRPSLFAQSQFGTV